MLTARNITKSFGGKSVLGGVSVEVAPGQITALIGPNGCGKSTLLRALSLLDPPDAGTVAVDEQNYHLPYKKGRRVPHPWPKLTIVFQQLFLWPHLTIRQNLTLPLRSLGRANPEGKVRELVASLDMAEFIDRYPNEISLGQRQRAAIGRAFALEPKYLLLDEITSALDIEQIGMVLNQMRVLRSRGTGILLVTHLIGFAKRAADQVLYMRDGLIEEAGGPEILSAPRSQHLMRFLSLVEGGA